MPVRVLIKTSESPEEQVYTSVPHSGIWYPPVGRTLQSHVSIHAQRHAFHLYLNLSLLQTCKVQLPVSFAKDLLCLLFIPQTFAKFS